MIRSYAFAPAAFCMVGLLALVPARAGGDPAPAPASASPSSAPKVAAVKPAMTAAQAAAALRAKRKPSRPPGPLKSLTFSAREGFSLRMVSDQDVTAEIRNGAGRTLARTAYTLQAGDWTLKPRNLAPGLYTVLLRTGPNLRSLRMKIVDAERGEGQPEWVLEKAAESSSADDPAAPRGAALAPDP